MVASTVTSLQNAKQQDVIYVTAVHRWRPLQLSLLFDKRLVFSPTSLNLSATDPPPFQKSVEQKNKQMKRRVVVAAKDYYKTKTAKCPCNLGTSIYSGQHRVCEFLQEPTCFPWEISLQIRTPNLVHRCQHPRTRQNFLIGYWRKLRMVCQHKLFPLLHKRQWRSSLNLLEKAVNKASQLTKWVIQIFARFLGMNNLLATETEHMSQTPTIFHDASNSIKHETWNICGTILEIPRILHETDPEPLRTNI